MRSIKHKILAIAIIPMLAIAFMLTASHIGNRTEDAEERLVNKARTTTRILASSIEYGIVSGNQEHTRSLLNNFVKDHEILRARVYDANNNLLHEISSNTSSTKNNPPTIQIENKILQSTENINDYTGIEAGPRRKIGTLTVDISTLDLEKEKKNIILEGVIITLLLLTITFFVTLVYLKRITNPFIKMLTDIDTIRDGNIGHQLETSSITELDALARHINNMSTSLKQARDELIEKSDNELYVERNKAHVTLESIGEGVITTDVQGNISYMNPAAEILTANRFRNVYGKSLHKILKVRKPESDSIDTYPFEKVVSDKENLHHYPHLTLVKPDKSEIVIKDTASPILDRSGDVIGMALIFHDFSSIKHMSDKLTYQATHDDLTDLYNRREFETQLHDALDDARERDTEHSLCYLDLDQFKIINDTCGHLAGDILLKQISQQIKNRIRRHDLLARLGGDEFGIIFYDTDIKEAEELANEVKNSVADFRYIWHDTAFDIGVSIGLVPINAAVNSHPELLMRADSACYIAKDNGRNCIHTYAPSDRDFIRRCDELQWYNRITEALDTDRFELFCQTIQPVSENCTQQKHYEILLRMIERDERVMPEQFIPAAERYLLMPRIDRWVIEAFLSLFEKQAIRNFGDNIYNINLSGQSLCNSEFIDYLIQRLQSNYINPSSLTFEITETAAISNLEKALHFINIMKEMGCKFALDDFGTGVSSFQYLHDLPVDYLKIDGKFVRNIHNNQINYSIIDAIIKIGHEQGLEIIAEYVEDEQIRQKLAHCDIDYIQGYAVDKPFPLQEIINPGS
ncbi:EAL domain-containing protein [Thiohalophilus sp.]|uniref:EAL domain-containing protein n=1 Tax=Thiohalophilus sp. TaxID=3028392 RepID=UPI0039760B37